MNDQDDELDPTDTTQAIVIPEELRTQNKPIPPTIRIYLERVDAGRIVDRIRVTKSRIVLGRSGANVDVEFDDPLLSRKHAALEVLGSNFIQIVDLASTNGTLVNDTSVATLRRLNPGDVIVVGNTRLRLVVEREF